MVGWPQTALNAAGISISLQFTRAWPTNKAVMSPFKSRSDKDRKPRPGKPARGGFSHGRVDGGQGGGRLQQVEIIELGPKGDGIARAGRDRIYIDRGLPGDVLKVRARRGEDGHIRGDIVDMLTPSQHRAQAPCPHYDQCGGCTLQHASDDFYRHWIDRTVRIALDKQGVRVREFLPTVFIAAGTRRRATFAAVKGGNNVMMGYYRRRSHDIHEVDTCLVSDPGIMGLREIMKPYLLKVLKGGKATDIFVQKIGAQFDVLITGNIGSDAEPDLACRQVLAQMVNETSVARISWRGRERDRIETIVARAPLISSFGNLNVAMPPAAFMQPTPEGQAALVSAVMAALPAKGKFADLFCGCGTFTGPMLERGPVDAYESVDTAIGALNKAKGSLPLKTFIRDLFRNPLKRDEANRYDAIVFDPPRAGAEDQCRAIAASRCRLLIGVSCNPATFARDARILTEGGYRLQSVQIVDQFTWSHHVEVIGVFHK